MFMNSLKRRPHGPLWIWAGCVGNVSAQVVAALIAKQKVLTLKCHTFLGISKAKRNVHFWTWQNVWSGLWHSNCFNALQVWQCQQISWLETRVTWSSEALHRKGWYISNWKDSQSDRSSLSSAPWRGRCQKTRSDGPGAWAIRTIISFIIIVSSTNPKFLVISHHHKTVLLTFVASRIFNFPHWF